MVDLSIIIGTYNRCDSLKLSVKSVMDMEVPPSTTWELLVVDNNSSDNTREVVNILKEESNVEIRYLHEKKQGLSYARNRGIEESLGRIIAFLDDDCIVAKGWLTTLINEFQSDPQLFGVGGRVELYDQRDKPVTIMTSRERRLFSSAGQLFSFMHGCNIAFKRQVFEVIGSFDVRLGPGTKVLAAEDTDFIYRAFKGGVRMLYSPDLCVQHNHGRRLDSQVASLLKGYTIGRGAFYCKHILGGDLMVLKMAYWQIAPLIKALFENSSSKDSWQKTLLYLRNLIVGVYYYSALRLGV